MAIERTAGIGNSTLVAGEFDPLTAERTFNLANGPQAVPLVIVGGVGGEGRRAILEGFGYERDDILPSSVWFGLQLHPFAQPDGSQLPMEPLISKPNEFDLDKSVEKAWRKRGEQMEKLARAYWIRTKNIVPGQVATVFIDNDRWGVTTEFWEWALRDRQGDFMKFVRPEVLAHIDAAVGSDEYQARLEASARDMASRAAWFYDQLQEVLTRRLGGPVTIWGQPSAEYAKVLLNPVLYRKEWAAAEPRQAFARSGLVMPNLYPRSVLWASDAEHIRTRARRGVEVALGLANGRPVYQCLRCVVPHDATRVDGRRPPVFSSPPQWWFDAAVLGAKEGGAHGFMIWERRGDANAQEGARRIRVAIDRAYADEFKPAPEPKPEPVPAPQPLMIDGATFRAYVGNLSDRHTAMGRDLEVLRKLGDIPDP